MSSILDVAYNIVLGYLSMLIIFAGSIPLWFLFWKEVAATLTFTKRRYPDPKTIVITGASAGIGRAFALEFAQPGNHLILIARNQDALDRVRVDCEKRRAHVEAVSVDVTAADEIKKYLLNLYEKRPFDLVIANAGVAGETVDGYDEQPWEQLYHRVNEVDFRGVMNTVMPVFQKMKETRHQGQIAIVASVTGFFGPPNFIWYNASKAALLSATRDLRYWASKEHIRVNTIVPGFIDTRMTQQLDTWVPRIIYQSPEQLVRRVRHGLIRNVAIIASPTYHWWILYAVNCLPPIVKERLVWIAGELRVVDGKMT